MTFFDGVLNWSQYATREERSSKSFKKIFPKLVSTFMEQGGGETSYSVFLFFPFSPCVAQWWFTSTCVYMHIYGGFIIHLVMI